MTKRILLLAALAALTLGPSALTSPPPGNLGHTSVRVEAPGKYVGNGKEEAPGAPAFVDASVRAGERPYAKAIPGHPDIDKIPLGAYGTQVHWKGEATATLTRTIQHPSSGVVTVEPPKTLTKDLIVKIERVNETIRHKILEKIPAFFNDQGNVNGAVVNPVWQKLGWKILDELSKEEMPDIELKVYEDLELYHDPLWKIETPAWAWTLPPQAQLLLSKLIMYEAIESSARLSGEWGNEIETPGTPTMKEIKVGPHDLYEESHSHGLLPLHP